MWQKILEWINGIKGWFNKMIGQTNVKDALHIDVAISQPMADALSLWSSMYTNEAPWLSNDVKSLNLAAAIAGEIARAVTIEMKVTLTGSARAQYLQAQIDRIIPKLRQMIEYGAAKGGLMFKPFPNGKNIDIDFVQADQFYPVSFDSNGNVTSCVFADQRRMGNDYYTRLEFHAMTSDGCVIKNQAFKSQTKDTLGQAISLELVDAWKGLVPEAMITGIDRPLYAYFRFPMANNIDSTSPLGVSCFARAAATGNNGTCLIQQADEVWSQLLWEFESGKRALYVDNSAFETDKTTGKKKLPNQRLYRTLNAMDAAEIGKEGFFEAWSPEFREASILSGLDAILKKIEFNCGLAFGTISDPQSVDKTATEIKISRQRSYATITDTQKAVSTAIDQLLWVMDIYASLYGLAPKGAYSSVYDFDDSVITDHDAQFTNDLKELDRTMSKVEFRMRNHKEDEATARKMIAMVSEEQAGNDLFSDNGKVVK